MLAWFVYLALGVGCVVLGWCWLAPRLPRRVRLAILWLLAGLAVLALAVTSRIPHDYMPGDVTEYVLGLVALVIQLLLALAGVAAALAAVGRRRVLNAGLCGLGLYLVGVGFVLYWLLNGVPTMQGPCLVLIGSALTVAAAGRLAGLPRWAARAFGLAAGVVIAMAVEALRGMGSRGSGPAAASRDVLSLVAIGAVLLLLSGVYFLRTQGRALAGPFSRAAIALAGTGLVLVLRGPGEWAPGPGPSSTTLYGLPLTLLVIAISLLMLDSPPNRSETPGRGRARLACRYGTPGWAPAMGLLALLVISAVWHPATESCADMPYAGSSPLNPDVAPLWALSPNPSSQRGAPDVAVFNKACGYHAPNPAQVVYTIYPTCKWAQVDPDYPLAQATGILKQIDLSAGDSPWIHFSHDLELELAVDPASAWLVLNDRSPGLLHVEVESGLFPVAYRPVAGDRVTVAGRWVFDCGHDPHTEVHPAAVVAGEHDEWRVDAAGKPQQVGVLQVWMNSAPGVVNVPLAPIDMRASFPSPPADQVVAPAVQVLAGVPDTVHWTVSAGAGVESGLEAAVHLEPPATQGSVYFELLLGYQKATPAPPLAPHEPISYTIAFDGLAVHDDLRQAARNTTGVPLGLAFPSLGFRGTNRWIMQAVVGHAWRSLLTDMPVVSGRTYSLEGVSPVQIVSPDDEHLHLTITGYAENDPSDGVELASGSVNGAAIVDWDAGQLANLCCGTGQTFTPTHGAWTLSYHVSRTPP